MTTLASRLAASGMLNAVAAAAASLRSSGTSANWFRRPAKAAGVNSGCGMIQPPPLVATRGGVGGLMVVRRVGVRDQQRGTSGHGCFRHG